jgi:hypothetical protein
LKKTASQELKEALEYAAFLENQLDLGRVLQHLDIVQKVAINCHDVRQLAFLKGSARASINLSA